MFCEKKKRFFVKLLFSFKKIYNTQLISIASVQKPKNKFFIYFPFITFLFFIGNLMPLYAQNTVPQEHKHIEQEGERIHLELLKDLNHKANFENISIYEVEKLNADFVPIKSLYLNLGFEEHAKWIRVKIPPHVEDKIFYLELEYPLLDSVSLFYKDTIFEFLASKT